MPAVWSATYYDTDSVNQETHVFCFTVAPQALTLPFFWQSSLVPGALSGILGDSQMLEIEGISADVITTATVGNRRLMLQFYHGGGLAYEYRCPNTQLLSTTRHYEFVPGIAPNIIGTTQSYENIGTIPLRLMNGTNLAFAMASVVDVLDTISVTIRGTVKF